MSSEDSPEEVDENLPLVKETTDDSTEEVVVENPPLIGEATEDSTEDANVNPPLNVETTEDSTEAMNVNLPPAAGETVEDDANPPLIVETIAEDMNLPLIGETIEDSVNVDVREGENTTRWELLCGELITMIYIAMPIVGLSASRYLIRATSMVMLGQLSGLALSSAAIAYSLCDVTGFSLITGMASALETLCGQAYGAGQYGKLGTYTYGAIIWMLVACIPISFTWIFFAEDIFILIGQDSVIAAEAGWFVACLVPSLFPCAIVQALVRYLQTQSLILPMFICSIATLGIHLPLSWALIFRSRLGSVGAAVSISASYWVNAILLWVYVQYSAKCAETRASSSMDVHDSMGEIIKVAIPSAGMTCLEWWIFQIIILLGGLLPNPQLEASVLSICLTIETMHYLVPSSFGSAASTRISYVLGEGRAEMAGVIVHAVSFLAVAEVVVASSVVFACSYNILGSMFSNDKSVAEHVNGMAHLLCLSFVVDGFQTALSGVVRGSGWQWTGAVVNLVAHYGVGISVAVLLGLKGPFGVHGLWWGVIAGTAMQCILYGFITFFCDWNTQVAETRQRLFPLETTS